MRKQTTAALGALALVLGLAGSAGAASSVDITYDLSDSIFISPATDAGWGLVVDILGSSMKIRYSSNSASSMPILHGPATLQSLTLQAHITVQGRGTSAPLTTANLNLSLVSPVAGTFLSSGTLTFGGAQLRVTGTRHCPIATYGLCIAVGGTLTSAVAALGPFTTAGTLNFAAAAGPYGGAQSTRHTVSGSVPVYAPTKFVGYFPSLHFATAVSIIGREVLREAEGHDPKVTPIPEPGTLLLLGAGTAGLAVVGRATRRSRH